MCVPFFFQTSLSKISFSFPAPNNDHVKVLHQNLWNSNIFQCYWFVTLHTHARARVCVCFVLCSFCCFQVVTPSAWASPSSPQDNRTESPQPSLRDIMQQEKTRSAGSDKKSKTVRWTERFSWWGVIWMRRSLRLGQLTDMFCAWTHRPIPQSPVPLPCLVLWVCFYHRPKEWDNSQMLATGVPKLKTLLGTQRPEKEEVDGFSHVCKSIWIFCPIISWACLSCCYVVGPNSPPPPLTSTPLHQCLPPPPTHPPDSHSFTSVWCVSHSCISVCCAPPPPPPPPDSHSFTSVWCVSHTIGVLCTCIW